MIIKKIKNIKIRTVLLITVLAMSAVFVKRHFGYHNNQNLLDKKLGAIVRLHTTSDGGFFCSGTIISPHLLLTAAHCVQPMLFIKPVKVSVRPASGQDIGAVGVTIGRDVRGDVALVMGDFSMFETMGIASNPTENVNAMLHDDLQACGYPRAGELFCAQFKFTNKEAFMSAGYGFLWPGMSGGPVIDVRTQRVVAVKSAVAAGGLVLVADVVEIFANLSIPFELRSELK